MLKLGRINKLPIVQVTESKYIARDGKHSFEIDKVAFRKKLSIGDIIEGFIYTDRDGKFLLSTRVPLAKMGEFAYLRVLNVIEKGAFVDWGIEADLFVPNSELEEPLSPRKSYVFFIKMDKKLKHITATTSIKEYLVEADQYIKENDEIDFLVSGLHRLGYRIIVNNRYQGIIFKDDIIGQLRIGEKRKGFIKNIREDGKLDITLFRNRTGYFRYAENIITNKLSQSGGFLPLTDNTLPQLIEDRLGMSKKVFKKAIGGLYKRKIIHIEEKGIRLSNNNYGSTSFHAPK